MSNWPIGYGRFVLAEVGSTLDEARLKVKDTPAPFWLLAHRQSAARGRRGRTWSMGQGNFAASLVLRIQEPPMQAALRSFVTSLALYRAFVELTGKPEAFVLKWPNDVLLNGGKVAGILLESAGQSDVLSIGIGINLVNAPDLADFEQGALPPVSLRGELSIVVTPEAFLDILASHYAVLERQFMDHGFAPIRLAWLAHAARLGETITARTTRESFTGIFQDVDAKGHLVLRGPRGVMSIAAADVFF
ncbi:MAG: biotin--[acetyl-CoA-carboxylase] ligase [Roseobacter sp.]